MAQIGDQICVRFSDHHAARPRACTDEADSPDIARVRTKVKIALMAAQSAVSDTATQIGSQARQIGKRTDGFVRDNPWQVIGVAAAVGLAVGLLAGRRSS